MTNITEFYPMLKESPPKPNTDNPLTKIRNNQHLQKILKDAQTRHTTQSHGKKRPQMHRERAEALERLLAGEDAYQNNPQQLAEDLEIAKKEIGIERGKINRKRFSRKGPLTVIDPTAEAEIIELDNLQHLLEMPASQTEKSEPITSEHSQFTEKQVREMLAQAGANPIDSGPLKTEEPNTGQEFPTSQERITEPPHALPDERIPAWALEPGNWSLYESLAERATGLNPQQRTKFIAEEVAGAALGKKVWEDAQDFLAHQNRTAHRTDEHSTEPLHSAEREIEIPVSAPVAPTVTVEEPITQTLAVPEPTLAHTPQQPLNVEVPPEYAAYSNDTPTTAYHELPPELTQQTLIPEAVEYLNPQLKLAHEQALRHKDNVFAQIYWSEQAYALGLGRDYAVSILLQASITHQQDGLFCLQIARHMENIGLPETALTIYLSLSQNAESLSAAARIQDALGHYEDAARSYRQALELKPRDYPVRNRLADILTLLGTPESLTEALAIHRGTLKFHPGDSHALAQIARLRAFLDMPISYTKAPVELPSENPIVKLAIYEVSEAIKAREVIESRKKLEEIAGISDPEIVAIAANTLNQLIPELYKNPDPAIQKALKGMDLSSAYFRDELLAWVLEEAAEIQARHDQSKFPSLFNKKRSEVIVAPRYEDGHQLNTISITMSNCNQYGTIEETLQALHTFRQEDIQAGIIGRITAGLGSLRYKVGHLFETALDKSQLLSNRMEMELVIGNTIAAGAAKIQAGFTGYFRDVGGFIKNMFAPVVTPPARHEGFNQFMDNVRHPAPPQATPNPSQIAAQEYYDDDEDEDPYSAKTIRFEHVSPDQIERNRALAYAAAIQAQVEERKVTPQRHKIKKEQYTAGSTESPPSSKYKITNQYDLAVIQKIDKEIAEEPRNTSLYEKKIIELDRIKNYEDAVPVYDAMVNVDPHNPKHYTDLALRLILLKRYEEALEVYDDMAKMGASIADKMIQSDAFYAKGYLYFANKDYEKALASYEEALKFTPKNSLILIDEAKLLYLLNRRDKAYIKYQALLKIRIYQEKTTLKQIDQQIEALQLQLDQRKKEIYDEESIELQKSLQQRINLLTEQYAESRELLQKTENFTINEVLEIIQNEIETHPITLPEITTLNNRSHRGKTTELSTQEISNVQKTPTLNPVTVAA